MLFSKLLHTFYAKSLHGTHSPFVYQFLQNIIYQPHSYYLNQNYQLLNPSAPNSHHILLKTLQHHAIKSFNGNNIPNQLETFLLDNNFQKNYESPQVLINPNFPLPSGRWTTHQWIFFLERPYLNTFLNFYHQMPAAIGLQFFHYFIIVQQPNQHKELFLLKENYIPRKYF